MIEMEGVIALIIPIVAIVGFFSTTIYWVHMFYTSRHRERMALLESGQDPAIFSKVSRPERILKIGILLFSVGAGILFGYLLDEMGMDGDAAYFSMIFLFGGAGLISYYTIYLRKKMEVSDTL